MRKLQLILLGFLSYGICSAQSFSDDFESYSEGDYIGIESDTWTTWSGSTGGSEDVQVTSDEASSGSNSIYFSSTSATGGPQDVVLPFGGEYNLGDFVFEMNFMVEEGNGGYFNFQAEETIGQVWALDCNMVQDGNIYIATQGVIQASGIYELGVWNNLIIDVSLTTNVWTVYLNDESLGSFSNAENQVASLDLFPVNQTAQGGNNLSSFWVDDVSYDYQEYILQPTNLGVISASMVGAQGLAGQSKNVSSELRNLGTEEINSFDIEMTYNGTTYNESVSGLSLGSLDFYTHDFADPVVLISGENDLVVTISNINGSGSDDDSTDDEKILTLDPVVPAVNKVVVGEEATGTWCQWCPRGAVMMDRMATNYDGYWAGVAVHNGDPMTVDPYDSQLSTVPGFGGYPGATVERNVFIDPLGIESQFLNLVQNAPSGTILNGAEVDLDNGMLNVSLSTTFTDAVTGNWKIACIIVEDDVTGTTSQYNQSNAYAGGDNGEMGGYEDLPSSVPASQMVYDHVGRAISPSFGGLPDAFPSVETGVAYVHNFSFEIGSEWEMDQIHILGILIQPDGKINNGGYSTLIDAEYNGFVEGEEVVGIAELGGPDIPMVLYPNPVNDVLNLNFNQSVGSELKIEIYTMEGKLMNSIHIESTQTYSLDVSGYESGMYLINVIDGDKIYSERIRVE